MIATSPVVLGDDDYIVKRGLTWTTDPAYITSRKIDIAAIFASSDSAQAVIRSTVNHGLSVGDRIVLEGTTCIPVLSVDGCYTVSAIVDDKAFVVSEQIAHNLSIRGVPACSNGTIGTPQDLTGYTVTGYVRANYAGEAYGPTAVGSIDAGSCEFYLTDCEPICPAIARCQVVDIPTAGISQAVVLKVERQPEAVISDRGACGRRVAPAKTIVTLSKRATIAATDTEMVLNTEALGSPLIDLDLACGSIQMTIQDTSVLPVAACCIKEVCNTDEGVVEAYGPYFYDITALSPTGEIASVQCGSLYLRPSSIG